MIMGVRQRCAPLPIPFIIYMNHITEKGNPDMEMLNELHFIDNQGLDIEDEWQLQKHVTSLNMMCRSTSIKLKSCQLVENKEMLGLTSVVHTPANKGV